MILLILIQIRVIVGIVTTTNVQRLHRVQQQLITNTNANNNNASSNEEDTTILDLAVRMERPRARLKAILWSQSHPTLLDARLSGPS